MKFRRTDTSLARAVPPSVAAPSATIVPLSAPRPVSTAIEPHPLSLHHDTLIPLIIWRQRALVLACAVLGMVAGALYVHFGTPIWKTEARIIPSATPLTADSQSTAMSDTFLNTQCELIRSSPILALAISNIDADNLQLFRDVHNRISYLKKNLAVDVDKHSDIDVDLETPYPDEAQKLVDAVVNAYHDFRRRQALAADGQMLSILQHEKDRRDAELDAKTAALDDLRVSENAVAIGGDNSITMQRLSTLSSALTAAQLDTVAAKSAYEQTAKSAGIDTTDPNWIAKNQADVSERNLANGVGDEASIRAQLFDLQQQMNVLQRQYLPGHPAIQALQSHIDQLTRAIVVSARDRWLTAQGREQALQGSYDAQQKVAFAQNARNGEAARLASDIKRLQDLSDSLDGRIKELSLASQAGTFNIQTVDDAATNSDDPVFPQAKFILPIGLLAGALAGVVLGLIRETSGFSINLKTLGGSGRKSMMGLPVFASVPRQAEVSIKHVAWSSHLRPESTIAVAFRKLRDALQAAAASDETLTAARTILVASPMNGEGRSIAASNLAITLAKSGKRVCLVDADLRLPSLARIYAVREDSGLTNVVTGLDPLAKALQRTVIERLDLLPAGPPVDDPAELLNSPQFVETLEDLTMKYDHVVVDSPSVLGAPDARIIAASCDATLLLLSQEGVSKKVAEQCRDGLQSVGAHVIGILMNSAPKRAQRGRDDRNDAGRSFRKQTLPDSPRSDIPQLPLRARA